MPFKRGVKRPSSAGRKAGTPNKRTVILEDITAACERMGFNPAEKLIELSQSSDWNISLGATKEICKYAYVQKRSVELTGQDGGPIKVQEEHPAVAEFKDLVKTLVDAKVKS